MCLGDITELVAGAGLDWADPLLGDPQLLAELVEVFGGLPSRTERLHGPGAEMEHPILPEV
jgi:hypothetical protein